MLRKVVVVAPPSPSKICVYCNQSINSSVILCGFCQKLQPFPSPAPTFFEVFNLPLSLKIDEMALRQAFYELSQKTHPDTQTQADDFVQMQAAKWSIYINKAFQTLKSTSARLDYILELNGTSLKSSSPPPTELAESYFDLQEALLEGSDDKAISDFLGKLETEERKLEADWQRLSSEWEQSPAKDNLLSQLKLFKDTQKYISSLKADLSKRKGVL